MDEIILNAPAKLNFTLDIVGKRGDGYHLMDMLMQTVDLCDEVTIKRAPRGISVGGCSGIDEKSNIAYKAAEAFFRRTAISGGCDITIRKQIPTGAGMAGGSADGAAALRGLNTLYDAGVPLDTLMEIGAEVGTDIPFCLFGGTARVSGIGERVRRIADFPDCFFVAAKPSVGVNTAQAFSDFDAMEITSRPDTEKTAAFIEKGDIVNAAESFLNVFEQVVKISEADDIKAMMRLCGGINPIMTGSGSAVFAVFTDEAAALGCYYKLSELSINAYVCKPARAESVRAEPVRAEAEDVQK